MTPFALVRSERAREKEKEKEREREREGGRKGERFKSFKYCSSA